MPRTFVIVIFAALLACAGTIKPASGAQHPAESGSAPRGRLPERERITYRVKWLGGTVGTITASINGIKKISGRDAYELEIIVKTNDFCSKIYPINDRYVSYMDVEGLYALRHEAYRREGRYKKDAVTDFDQVNHVAHFKNFLDKSEKTIAVPPAVQDPVTIGYYFRTVPIKAGERIVSNVYNNEQIYELFGVAGAKKRIRIPKIGYREAFHVQPYAKLKGEVVRKGKANGYFSWDEKRIPLLVSVRAPFFTEITAYIVKVE